MGGDFIMDTLSNIRKKLISSRSPNIINDYINNINNMDEHTLKAKNSNITETLISSQHIAGSDIHHVSMGMEVTIKSVPLTTYHIFCPLKGKIYSNNISKTLLPNDFLIVPPSCPVDVIWEHLSQGITITIDPVSLKEYFKILPEFSDKAKEIKLSSGTHGAAAISNLINYINSTKKDNPLLMESDNMQKNCENLLFETLSLSSPELKKAKEIQILPHHIKQAIEYIEENIHNNITMNDLVISTGVSRRSLEMNFTKSFQISPMKFITNKKLELVRDILIKSRPEKTSVIDISEKFGFQHASHFSMLYQRRYLEKPSKTLKTRY